MENMEDAMERTSLQMAAMQKRIKRMPEKRSALEESEPAVPPLPGPPWRIMEINPSLERLNGQPEVQCYGCHYSGDTAIVTGGALRKANASYVALVLETKYTAEEPLEHIVALDKSAGPSVLGIVRSLLHRLGASLANALRRRHLGITRLGVSRC